MYKYNFVSEWFDIDAIMVDMDMNFLNDVFPQLTVCILHSLLSKAIHMDSAQTAPGTISFICQFATSILDATLLSYAVFIDLNRCVLSVCLYSARNDRIASAVLATAIPSVCLSVRHTPVLCQNGGT